MVFDQPDWTRPYQQYTAPPGGTYWCTATADAGDHEPFAVAIGTLYEHVKWFHGRGIANGSTSNAPTHTAASRLRCSWPTVGRTSPGQALESTPHCSPAFPPVRSLESTKQRCSNCLSGTKLRIAK